MKVLLVNGSPHKEGCTYTALREVEKELNNQNIETEIFYFITVDVRLGAINIFTPFPYDYFYKCTFLLEHIRERIY